MANRSRKRRQRRKANYRKATPQKVAEAVLRVRAQPGMKSPRFINPSR